MNLTNLFSDPVDTLLSLLTALPGVLLALSIHEAAHGWVAYRCGDPTAKMMGRITLNPMKHIDPVGFFCMLFVGFGWAKPVPVNPNNYRNYRKDDLKVSLAGITANLFLFFISFVILMSVTTALYSNVPTFDSFGEYKAYVDENGFANESGYAVRNFAAAYIDEGKTHIGAFEMGDTVFEVQDNGRYGVKRAYYYHCDEEQLFKDWNISGGYRLASVMGGRAAKIVYEMLWSFSMLNLCLAVFNFIPLPPLDGYHVLNDLILKRPLFADIRAQRIGTGILFAIIMLGNVDPRLDIISIVLEGVTDGASSLLAGGWYAFLHIINFI